MTLTFKPTADGRTPTRPERRTRSYRELQADGQAQREGTCRECGRPYTDPAAPPLAVDRERVEALAGPGAKLAAEVRRSVDDGAWGSWLGRCVLADASADELTVACPVERASWTVQRFGRVLEACASSLAGRAVRVWVVGGDVAGCEAWTFGAMT